MHTQLIKPVDSTAKSAAISKYSPNRQGGEGGRGQRSPNSYRPGPEKLEKEEAKRGFDSSSQARTHGREDSSSFQSLLKKSMEENARMQEVAKVSEAVNETTNPAYAEWVWGLSGNYMRFKK